MADVITHDSAFFPPTIFPTLVLVLYFSSSISLFVPLLSFKSTTKMIHFRLNLSRPIIHPGIMWLNLNVLLLSLVFSSSAVTAQRRNGTQDNQYGIYTNFDPTIALVIVVLVCAFFLLGVFSMFIRQCSEPAVVSNLSSAAARNISRQIGLDPAVIEKFPVFFYSEVKHVKIGRETLECAICLSEFEDAETLRLLPKCNHVFHPECIDEWLASHVTCPVCRAVLTIDSAETSKVSPQETVTDLNQEDIAANLSQSSNEVAITVNAEQNQDSTQSRPTNISNTSQGKNRQSRSSISGRFPRSHSTGHSLVQGGENIERYTLRLPEEVRTQIMANAKLKRTLSVNVISTKEWSVRKGEGSSRGKQIGWSERWSILIHPAFVSKGSGVKSCSKIDNEGDSDSVNGRNLLAAVKLNCLNLKVEGAEEASTGARAPV